MNLLLGFAIAVLISMVLIPPLGRLAARLHVVDEPGLRKVHVVPVPRAGGLAMGAAAIATALLWLPLDNLLLAYLSGAVGLLFFGAADDRYTLGPTSKALGQLAAITAFLVISHVHFDSLVLSERIALPAWLGYAFTLLFLMAVTNAVNLADGLDGLAGGLALLSCAAIALLAQTWGLVLPAAVGVFTAGAIFGFLRFNTWPARVFMGDAGSQFLGYTIGVLAVCLVHDNATSLSSMLPLLLVGLPLIDTLSVMTLRIAAGRSPFDADRRHLHHRLLALGFDHYEAVATIYSVQCLLLLLGWQLRFASDTLIIVLFAVLVLLCVLGIGLLEAKGWRWRHDAQTGDSPMARAARWLAAGERLPRWALRTACVVTATYWLGVACYAEPIPRDVRWLAVAGALTLTAGFYWRRSELVVQWLVRGALYVAVMTAVYLDHHLPQKVALLQTLKFVALPVLALAVIVTVRLSRDRRFGATPLDLLLVFGALALPNLPGLQSASADLGISVAKLFALSYAVELIAAMGTRLRAALELAGLVFFMLVALR